MEPRGVRDKWIYIMVEDLVIRFRVRSQNPFFCACIGRPLGVIDYTAIAVHLNRAFSYTGICESCWQKALDRYNVVFLAPEEGRPYFEKCSV